MTYPFVPSAHDLGPAKGPRLAVVWHMAEGGGTVGYLSRPNANGVSVHFVVEYTGRIVQMLALDHMHSSIRTSDIRTTDDMPYPEGDEIVTYGRTAARAALGDWADIAHGTLGPNHATIAVEVEGFAKDGPNAKQTVAITSLARDLDAKAHLGHRDFADYKACPGHDFPWSWVGGHGERVAMDWKITTGYPGTFTCTTRQGAGWIHPDTGKVTPMPQGTVVNIIAHAHVGAPWNLPGYLGSDATIHGRLVLAGDGTFVPSLPCPPTDCAIQDAKIAEAIRVLST